MTNGEKFLQVYGGLPVAFYDETDNVTDLYFPGNWWDEEYTDPEESEETDE